MCLSSCKLFLLLCNLMSFPVNPNRGDTHTFEDTVYTYNGRSWDRTSVGANNSTSYANNMITAALLHRIAHLEALIEKAFLVID